VNQWPFILGAYALTALGTLALFGWSYAAMRRAEREAETLGRDR
jgi:hypothetical protein